MITASPRTKSISIFRVAVCGLYRERQCDAAALSHAFSCTHPHAMLTAILCNVHDRHLLLDVRQHKVAVRVESL
jgi:hypothetical protein